MTARPPYRPRDIILSIISCLILAVSTVASTRQVVPNDAVPYDGAGSILDVYCSTFTAPTVKAVRMTRIPVTVITVPKMSTAVL